MAIEMNDMCRSLIVFKLCAFYQYKHRMTADMSRLNVSRFGYAKTN